MPEAVGVWMARCELGLWRFHWQEFIDDGRYLTIYYAPMTSISFQLRPTYLSTEDDTYRVESRWEGRMLWVRLPGGRWEEFARFVEGRFVSSHDAEAEYAREGRMQYISMAADRAPHDYEEAGRWNRRRQAVFDTLSGAVAPCFTREALSSEPQFQPEQQSHLGDIEFHLGRDGQISQVVVHIPYTTIAACVQAALVGVQVEGYSAPESGNYRYPLSFSPE